MPSAEDDSGSRATPVRRRDYTARSGVRHRSANGTRRLMFFTLASVWGFIAGVAGLLAAMSAAGQPVQPSAAAVMGLTPAFVLAAGGGLVIAAAYKESKRRARS
jgi:hypothetical protein